MVLLVLTKFIILVRVTLFIIHSRLYCNNVTVVGKTIGTLRPNGPGQLPVEARAEDGKVCATIAAADEDGQRRHGTPPTCREHGQVPVATRQRSAGHGLAPGVRRQPEGAGPTFAAERVPRVAGQGQEVSATGVPVRGTHTVQQGQTIPRPNGEYNKIPRAKTMVKDASAFNHVGRSLTPPPPLTFLLGNREPGNSM